MSSSDWTRLHHEYRPDMAWFLSRPHRRQNMVRKSGGYPVRRAEWDAFVSSNGWSGGCALNVDTGENRLGLFDDRGKPSACSIETKARRRRPVGIDEALPGHHVADMHDAGA